ncbi:isochorismatase family cysteine hydrolase [Microbacterium panaciterrae]|uniref:Isochorismatase-like domain-containing protein n=1 Tax=Microbacterium panaciterrae TaxID=985759 RepID=A0ABP8PUH5_9MICO
MHITGSTVLIVVDFQGGSIDHIPDGQQPTADHFERVAMRDRAKALISQCRDTDIPVVWIQEVHKPHLQDIGRELDGSEGPHCVEGWEGTPIADGLVPTADEFHIPKRRYSAFFGTELDIVLKAYKAESVILIGGFTDICVLYTAIDAHQRDFHVRVVTDIVGGSSKQAHDDALEMVRYVQRNSLVTSDDVSAWLAQQPALV